MEIYNKCFTLQRDPMQYQYFRFYVGHTKDLASLHTKTRGDYNIQRFYMKIYTKNMLNYSLIYIELVDHFFVKTVRASKPKK
ncbi:hypothetical protein V1477_020567 [Vespula maculifrons]|uniref:Uncharacterized protein n=1 Tax=Vespula maculifrons TaxID=7453 RepID=A0ABD2AN55_VESMC